MELIGVAPIESPLKPKRVMPCQKTKRSDEQSRGILASAQRLRVGPVEAYCPDALFRPFHIEVVKILPDTVQGSLNVSFFQSRAVRFHDVAMLQNDRKTVSEPEPLHIPKRLLPG